MSFTLFSEGRASHNGNDRNMWRKKTDSCSKKKQMVSASSSQAPWEGRERSPHPKGEQRQAVLASGQATALQTPNQLWVLVK